MLATSKHTVLRSINDDGESRCVDFFVREDGTIGFEEYRRDVEDNHGWFAVGGYSSRSFYDENAAIKAARCEIPWLQRKSL
jgi:hypothetical protein